VFDRSPLCSFLLERHSTGRCGCSEYEIDADSFLRIPRTPEANDWLRAGVLIPKIEIVTASGNIDDDAIAFPVDAAAVKVPSCDRHGWRCRRIDFNFEPGDALGHARWFTHDGRPSSYGVIWCGAIRERRACPGDSVHRP
jgi:hypothetical protein